MCGAIERPVVVDDAVCTIPELEVHGPVSLNPPSRWHPLHQVCPPIGAILARRSGFAVFPTLRMLRKRRADRAEAARHAQLASVHPTTSFPFPASSSDRDTERFSAPLWSIVRHWAGGPVSVERMTTTGSVEDASRRFDGSPASSHRQGRHRRWASQTAPVNSSCSVGARQRMRCFVAPKIERRAAAWARAGRLLGPGVRRRGHGIFAHPMTGETERRGRRSFTERP